jgi:hypothetical protein
VRRRGLRPQACPAQVTSKEFLRQLIQGVVYFFIAPKVAESLITKRVEPVIPPSDMMPRVSGTVINAFELTKDGKARAMRCRFRVLGYCVKQFSLLSNSGHSNPMCLTVSHSP